MKIRCLCLILGILIFAPTIQAQIVCTGPGCAFLPISQSTLDQMYYDLKDQYMDKLFDDMAVAAALANASGAPAGTVNLSGWTVGASVGAGYLPLKKVNVPITGYGEIKDMPRTGAAVNPRIFLGCNLGWLLNNPYDPFDSDSTQSAPFFLSPAKFDVYASFIEDRRTFDSGDQGHIIVNTRNRGFDVRYHLVEGKPLAAGPLLRFLGVSLGAGYHTALLDLNATQTKGQKLKLNAASGTSMIWDGAILATMRSELKTIPVELMTGMQFLYFLNFTFGGGMAYSKGGVDFNLTRVGPVYVSGDSAALLAAAAGQSVTSSAYTSYLTMTLNGSGKVPKNVAYGKLGLDINLLWLKIFAEGMYSKRAYGANVGVRFQM